MTLAHGAARPPLSTPRTRLASVGVESWSLGAGNASQLRALPSYLMYDVLSKANLDAKWLTYMPHTTLQPVSVPQPYEALHTVGDNSMYPRCTWAGSYHGNSLRQHRRHTGSRDALPADMGCGSLCTNDSSTASEKYGNGYPQPSSAKCVVYVW
ncbi:hypothetical protein BU16DRAFT_567477 [Lophium mytilinum]|uniref:Uncharacterized protein n=1 Tax=Lophium mytilinum TaxID=390894 RepID=A0A6A6QBB9_9PEZI|nr:hypothetical protein BU16DRAFT_567477 [Lophium mytilinum]